MGSVSDVSGGFLSAEALDRLNGDNDLNLKQVQVYRAPNFAKDGVDFALFFKSPGDAERRRVDFFIDSDEVYENREDIEDYVLRKARAAIMKELDK
jgi:hypothetical protein